MNLSSRKPKKDKGYEIKKIIVVGLIPFKSKSIITPIKDEKIKADYNYEKFKETFEKEMEKLSNGY